MSINHIKFSVCNDHFYGDNCNISCGHCRNNGGCNNITGHCPGGCQANWQGEKCDGRLYNKVLVLQFKYVI